MTRAVELAQVASLGVSEAFKNRIINGGMTVDQRNNGASVTVVRLANAVFPIDRWSVFNGGVNNGNVTANKDDVSSPTGFGFINSLLLTNVTGGAANSADNYSFFQAIEGLNISDFSWGTSSAKTVTVSFYVRASVTGTYGVSIRNSAANRSFVAPFTINAANTYEYKTVTIPGDTSGTWLTTNGVGLYLSFAIGVGSNFQTSSTNSWLAGNFFAVTGQVNQCTTSGATFQITGVQLEVGSSATSFEYRPYGTELALCQRYFAIGLNGDTDMNWPVVRDVATAFQFVVTVPVSMRATPTMGVPSGFGRLIAYDTSFNLSVGSVTALTLQYFLAGTQANIYGTNSSISGSAGVFCGFDTAGRGGNLTFSAEL